MYSDCVQDADPIDPHAEAPELSNTLAQSVLQLMTSADEYAENVGVLWANIGAVPPLLRFLCGGVELTDIVSPEEPSEPMPADVTVTQDTAGTCDACLFLFQWSTC